MRPSILIAVSFCVSIAQAIETPQLTIQTLPLHGVDGFTLEWDAVAGANRYSVVLRDTLFQQESLLFTTAKTSHWIPERDGYGEIIQRRFFRVVADSVGLPHEPDMTLVPAGTFTKGDDLAGYPEQQVTLSKDYFLGTFEVTNRQYMEQLQWAYDTGRVTVEDGGVHAYGMLLLDLEDTGEIFFEDGQFRLAPTSYSSSFQAYPLGYDPGNHPVREVSFFGAACYCDWLSIRSGIPPYYEGEWNQTPEHSPYEHPGYRLPTDAEWERAARFDDMRQYPWGDEAVSCDRVNYNNSAGCVGWTLPVGSLPEGASSLGLLDMAGSMAEWTGDINGLQSGDLVDPLGPQSIGVGVTRGGSFSASAWSLRLVRKSGQGHVTTNRYIGFRVCRTNGISANHAPDAPAAPSPAMHEYGVAEVSLLSWSGTDTDEDPLVFDVYFGTDPSPMDGAPLAVDLAAFSIDPGALADSTIYYWQIVSRDPEGYETAGPVWRFSTTTAPTWPGEMTLVPAGTFTMGLDGIETPEHEVTLQQDFLLGTREVTHAEFLEVLQWGVDNGMVEVYGSCAWAWEECLCRLNYDDSEILFADGLFSVTPSTHPGASAAYPEGYDPWFLPTSRVTWYGAAVYCDLRSLMEGLAPYYNGNWDQEAGHDPYTAEGYRLPTEAEWEYAARLADGRPYPWGSTYPSATLVNAGNFVGWKTPGGSYAAGANSLGMFDMAGNVSEWTGDRYDDYPAGPEINPHGAMAGSHRVHRGGGFNSSALYVNCAKRNHNLPGSSGAFSGIGFRPCRTAP